MRKCECGGMVTDCLGELEDYNNPCICKDLEIQSLQAKVKGLEGAIESALRISVLWEAESNVTPEHRGEADALCRMKERFKNLLKGKEEKEICPLCRNTGLDHTGHDCKCGRKSEIRIK
jgi:hypothetical protein